jgi:cytochrome c oxidase subunit 2
MPIRIFNRFRRLPLFALLVLALALLASCTPHHNQSTFGTAGPVAERQKDIFALIFWVAMAVFVVVEVAIVAITLRYRKKKPEGLPPDLHGNNRLEVAWTIAPAVVLAVIAIPTVNMIFSLDREATQAAGNLEVVVTGHQWWWEVEYTGEDVVTANEVRIPVGTAVRIVLKSEDVIHSFWVPKLAGKVDLIPTRTNQLVVQASEPGVYYGQCAEFCGEAHALMRFRVVASEQADFDAWLVAMRRPAVPPDPGTPAAAGQTLFAGNCSMCHSNQTTNTALARAEHSTQRTRQQQFLQEPEDSFIVAAPNLTHLATRTTLGAGLAELNQDTLAAWLRDPQDLKPGNRMKKLANVYRSGGLSEEQVGQLVAYLMTLEPGPAGQPTVTPPTADPVERGRQLFASSGCNGCHATTPDNIVGPGLGGIAARAATRRPGMSADEYLKESIVNPTAYTVEGFPLVMPANFGQVLSAEEIDALIAYLKTLQ